MTRFLLGCFLVFGLPLPAQAHELPDGHIERRVQVVVKPDCVLVEYSLAMNEATLEKELLQRGEKPADSLAAMWKQYREVILASLPQCMRVTVDGERTPLKPVRAEFSGWSHLHLTCLLRSEVRLTRELTSIVVTDSNFLDAFGNYRIAMKGRSGARLERSTVPPLVTRAEPVVLAKLTKQQSQAATRAQGEFLLQQRQ